MNTRPALMAAAATMLIAAGAAALPPAFAQSAGNAPSPTAAQLDAAQVAARVRDAGYGSIDEIERERDRFEVKTRDANGRRVELYVDALTGEILRSKRDDDDGAASGKR